MVEGRPTSIETTNFPAGFSSSLYDAANADSHAPAQEVQSEFSSITPVEQGKSSALSGDNKRSEGFYVCIAIVVLGIHVKTGKPVSFLMHYNPLVHFDKPPQEHYQSWYESQQQKFLEQFKNEMRAVVADLVPGTVSHMFCGGHSEPLRDKAAYDGATSALGDILESISGTRTHILAPPVAPGGDGKPMGVTSVYINTEQRKVHVLRYSPS